MIHEKLRTHAEIKKDVVIIGRNTLAEIWDKDLFDKYVESEDKEEIMEYINEAGIPT
jgi:DNA-binding transcriptional regulator/RsmH inhibitor MraZ